jgi:hypothetical protein
MGDLTFAFVEGGAGIVLDDVVHALFDGLDNFGDMAVAEFLRL